MTIRENPPPLQPVADHHIPEPRPACTCGRTMLYTIGHNSWSCPIAGWRQIAGHTWFLGDEDRERYLAGWRP